MCGRLLYTASPAEIAAALGADDDWSETAIPLSLDTRPTSHVPVVLLEGGRRVLRAARWGLAPGWALAKGVKPQINARAETVALKPFFRAAFKARRCVLVASGFYEWQAVEGARHKIKHAVRPTSGPVLPIAALWEPGDEPSTALVTVEPNSTMSLIHDRMPALLDAAGVAAWLDPATPADALHALLRPSPVGWIDARAEGGVVAEPVQRRLAFG